ncbi:MAG: class I mannose-6-phosphate isomerase [Bacteroidales bacterium]|mgnify:CR=1 FL=1|nr:class I mannose-6-phosphate isomerase [Bacteroidales bacterium]
MKKLYPLKFRPILKSRVWGGPRIVKEYGREAEEGADASHIGESWDLCDMPDCESIVENGFLEGNDIADILETYLGDLVGDKVFEYYGLQFPLLVKILDIDGAISLQVHPNDEIAAERYDAYGKEEVWYVLDAKKDACVYMGFRRDVSVAEFYEKCKNGTAIELLNVFHPKKGDCFIVKPGTVHAASGGILLSEIQEPSDLTFRLYDWGRELNPATAREMHLEEAIDCINYNKFDVENCYIKGVKDNRHIYEGEHFNITNIALSDTYHIYTDNFKSCIAYICTEGEALIQVVNEKGNEIYPLKRGEIILIPATMSDFFVSPKAVGTNLLEVSFPEHHEEDLYVDPSVAASCGDEDCDCDEADCDDDECDCGHGHHHGHHHHECGCGHHH